jgi:hypothetical protein
MPAAAMPTTKRMLLSISSWLAAVMRGFARRNGREAL